MFKGSKRKEAVEMSRNSSTTSGGLGFGSVLQLIFIVLKLCKVIDWKWVWVLSPTWIGFVIALIVVVIFVAITKIEKRRIKRGNNK